MTINGTIRKYTRPIRLGMVSGGMDAFIGAVHRIAARLDGEFELVAAALSSIPEKALASGQVLGLKEDRVHGSFEDMAKREGWLKDGIEAVSIVTQTTSIMLRRINFCGAIFTSSATSR